MSTEEDVNDKNKRNSNGGFLRYMIISLTCLLGFGAIISFVPTETTIGSIQTTSVRENLRSSSNSNSLESSEKEILEIEKKTAAMELMEDEVETEEDFTKVATTLKDAKMDIQEAEEEAVAKSEDALQETLKAVELDLKKALEQLLSKRKGYSEEQVKDVEDAVVKQLEAEVTQRLESEADLIAEDAEQDMDTVFENDILAKVESKEIESDVNAMREYFVEEAQREVDYVANHIKDNVRDIAEDVEKKVIAEKLKLDTSESELEEAELQVKVTDVMADINKSEENELSELEFQVAQQVEEVKENVKEVLKEFLFKEKNLSEEEVDKIEKEISRKFEEEATSKIKDKTESVGNEVNQAMHIELDGLIEEDKFIINRAKELGLTNPNNGSPSAKKDVDLIEKDISIVKNNFDTYIKEISESIADEFKTSIQEMMEKVEKEVLDENEIDITKIEMDNLIEKEKKKAPNGH